MRVCLITTFPPSRHHLSEYGFHLADDSGGRISISQFSVTCMRFRSLIILNCQAFEFAAVGAWAPWITRCAF